MSNEIQAKDNEANLSIVSIAFDAAEMRRMNRALQLLHITFICQIVSPKYEPLLSLQQYSLDVFTKVKA